MNTFASPKAYTLRFLKCEQVAKDAYSFYFRKPRDFSFIPGQYGRLILDHDHRDDRGTTRLFSLASSPLAPEIMITTRVLQSTFKKILPTLKKNDLIQFFAPMGRFVYSESETRPYIFLAGGIGITPFHSILTYASEEKLRHPMTLFVSFSTIEDVIYYEELMKIAKEHENIKAVYTITRPEESKKKWHGETGRINANLIKKYAPKFASSKFMISGPPTMVEAMEKMVSEMNVPEDQIQTEQFTGY